MNKKLESIIDRVLGWPAEAQDEAVRALTAIEAGHVGVQPPIGDEQQQKLAALRDMVNRSIERAGSFTDEEIEASISTRLDAWERGRKSR
jgi:hypothetical protein